MVNYRFMPILAIDPGQRMGWAIWHPERRAVFSGGEKLDGDNPGTRFASFIKALDRVLEETGLAGDLRTFAVMEAPGLTQENSWTQLEYALGWHAILHLWAHRAGLMEPRRIPIMSWRSHFLRQKKPPQLKGPDASKWYKREVIVQCQALGRDPKSDNEADAIGILKYVIDGGVAHLDKIEAEKRAATNAKRAQAMLMPLPEMTKPKPVRRKQDAA